MRLRCPICGERDSREFTYVGSADLLDRPDGDAGGEAFHAYLHIRENVAGRNAELWHHVLGCSSWLRVERDTVTHQIFEVSLARGAGS